LNARQPAINRKPITPNRRPLSRGFIHPPT